MVIESAWSYQTAITVFGKTDTYISLMLEVLGGITCDDFDDEFWCFFNCLPFFVISSDLNYVKKSADINRHSDLRFFCLLTKHNTIRP